MHCVIKCKNRMHIINHTSHASHLPALPGKWRVLDQAYKFEVLDILLKCLEAEDGLVNVTAATCARLVQDCDVPPRVIDALLAEFAKRTHSTSNSNSSGGEKEGEQTWTFDEEAVCRFRATEFLEKGSVGTAALDYLMLRVLFGHASGNICYNCLFAWKTRVFPLSLLFPSVPFYSLLFPSLLFSSVLPLPRTSLLYCLRPSVLSSGLCLLCCCARGGVGADILLGNPDCIHAFIHASKVGVPPGAPRTKHTLAPLLPASPPNATNTFFSCRPDARGSRK